MTTKDIARIAGVSPSTVSRSLNGNPRISIETRDRIKRIAEDLDFEFDASARSLTTGKSGTVACIVPDFLGKFANTLYLNPLIYHIREGLAAQGLDCIVTEALSPSGESNVRRLVLRRKVDGLILLLESVRAEDWGVIKKRGIPVVHAHYSPEYPWKLNDYFFTDNAAGGRKAAEALAKAGCGRLACVMDRNRKPEMLDRDRGFREALDTKGLAVSPELRLEAENSYEAAYSRVMESRAALRGADGVFVATDIMAMGVLRALDDLGFSVPGDIKVVGFDDIELCAYLKPSLSSIRQPREEIARLTCDRLRYLIGGGSPGGGRLIEPEFVGRESC